MFSVNNTYKQVSIHTPISHWAPGRQVHLSLSLIIWEPASCCPACDWLTLVQVWPWDAVRPACCKRSSLISSITAGATNSRAEAACCRPPSSSMLKQINNHLLWATPTWLFIPCRGNEHNHPRPSTGRKKRVKGKTASLLDIMQVK